MQDTPLPEISDSRDEPAAAQVPALKPTAALDIENLDLSALAVSKFGDWRGNVATARKTLDGAVHDLTTQAKVDEAKSLRFRLIGRPRADARKVSKALKSKLAATSKVVGAEEEAAVAAYDAAEMLISPQIDARETELAAEKAAAEQLEAERIAKHQDGLAKIRSFLGYCQGLPAVRIALGIEQLQGQVYGEDWQEFAVPAAIEQRSTLEAMRTLHAQTVEREAEDARLEAERKAEAARLEAQRAEQDRVAAEQAEATRQLADQRAELARQQKAIADNVFRVTGLHGRIAEIRAAATGHERSTASDLAEAITAVAALDVSEGQFQEFHIVAGLALDQTLAALQVAHADAIKRAEADVAARIAAAVAAEAEKARKAAEAEAQRIAAAEQLDREKKAALIAAELAEQRRYADTTKAAQTIAVKLPLAVEMGVIEPTHAERIADLAAELTADFVISNAAKHEPATLTLGAICERLSGGLPGLTVSGAFLAEVLHIRPAATERRGSYFTEAQYQAICRQLIAHVGAMAELHRVD